MKVEGPSKSQKTSKTSKTGQANKADGTFEAMVTGGVKETSGPAASQSIAKVDALLAVQGAEDPTERATRGRMRERGENVLRKLDNIRLGILTGQLNIGQLIDIADVVASHREKITDAEMSAVLDEIDLRAQIEIAKMRKAMGAKI